VHGGFIFSRELGDAISTTGPLNQNATSGSIMLYAGWQVDGEPCGAPNEGFMPVPRQLLATVVYDSTVAFSFWETDDTPKLLN